MAGFGIGSKWIKQNICSAYCLSEKKASSAYYDRYGYAWELLKEEEPLTKRIGELEQKRQKALIHLAVENRTIKKDTPMTKVIESAPTPQLRQILSQLYKALDQSTHEAKELSDNNAVLIKAAMKAAAYHLNRIGGAQVEPAYGSRGGEVVSHRKNFEFDA